MEHGWKNVASFEINRMNDKPKDSKVLRPARTGSLSRRDAVKAVKSVMAKLKPKFEIGDKVWIVIGSVEGGPYHCTIHFECIRGIFREDEITYLYKIKGQKNSYEPDKYELEVYENMCFRTEEEALSRVKEILQEMKSQL